MAEDAALTRFANSQIHQNVAETQRRRSTCASSSASGSAWPRPAGPTTRACAGWPPTPRAIARVVEELEDWGGLPGPTDGRRRRGRPTAPATAERHARSSGPRASARSSPRPTRPASPPTARSRPAPRRWPSPTRRASAPARDPDRRPAPHGVDGPGRRHRLRGGRPPSTPRPSTPRRSAGRRPTRPARRRTRSPSMPATTRSSSRSTRSSTCSTCSATSGSQRLAVQEERSFVELGKRIGSDLVTITDDGRDPAGLPMCVRLRGRRQAARPARRGRRLPRRRLRRADRGARRRRVDRPRPAGAEPVRPVPAEHGHGRRDGVARRADRRLDRGLLVTRFHYTNPVHPKLAIVTGMTRDGTFLVEGGKDRRRRSGTCGSPRATSRRWPGPWRSRSERKTLKGFLGGVVVPAVRIDGWTFTGTTEH